MPENIEKVQLPGVDCAILWGFEQIGLWLGISGAQARSRANAGLIRGRNVVFAIKSEINTHLCDLARKSRSNVTAAYQVGG